MPKCPNCDSSENVVLKRTFTKAGTIAGVVAGGVAGYYNNTGGKAGDAMGLAGSVLPAGTCAAAGALVGSAMPGAGTLIGAGIGATAGSILRALGGSAKGAATGYIAGHQVDKLMGIYVCQKCDKEFEAEVD